MTKKEQRKKIVTLFKFTLITNVSCLLLSESLLDKLDTPHVYYHALVTASFCSSYLASSFSSFSIMVLLKLFGPVV